MPRRCGATRGSLGARPIRTHRPPWSIWIGPGAGDLVSFVSIARVRRNLVSLSTAGKELQHGWGIDYHTVTLTRLLTLLLNPR